MLEFRPAGPRRHSAYWLLAIFAAITVLPIVLLINVAAGSRNLAYDLTGDAVVIHYGTARIVVPRAELKQAYLLDRPTGGRRYVGTAMPGLYQGRWGFTETGRITLYATAKRDLVVLETAAGKWGLTPADPKGFLQALSAGQTGQWAPVAGSSPWLFLLPMMGLLLLVTGVGGGVVWYYLRLPPTILYTLTDEGVLIQGGRLRLLLPYRDISDVQLRSPHGGPWRKFGAQLPGLIWGSFAWKDAGPNLRIYATQLKPLVLVSSGGATYGISPEDGERFVAELRQRVNRL